MKSHRVKAPFTLLEVVIGIAILALAGGFFSLRWMAYIEKKRFRIAAEKLFFELSSCQRLAVYRQADWEAVFELQETKWVLTSRCTEESQMAPCTSTFLNWDVLLNKKKKDFLVWHFFSNGQVTPLGELTLKKGEEEFVLSLSSLFQREERDPESKKQEPSRAVP